MDAGIYMLGLIILLFTLVFGMFDVNVNSSMKQNLYESVRSANQNALLELEAKYQEGEELTTIEMLEEWLSEFAQNNDLSYSELKINFVQMETEPPVYLVYIEGHKDQYKVLGSGTMDAFVKYHSGSTLITDDVPDAGEGEGE